MNKKISVLRKAWNIMRGRHSRALKDAKDNRDDGPAVKWRDGTQLWYCDGQLHREDGPAFVWPNGSSAWYRNGQLHRDGGPAIEYADGRKLWYRRGLLHREDGPAVVRPDGRQEWHIHGKVLSAPEIAAAMKKQALAAQQRQAAEIKAMSNGITQAHKPLRPVRFKLR